MHPTIKQILRRKSSASLIVAELALSCAIMSNSVHMVLARQRYMQEPTGLEDDELVVIESTPSNGEKPTPQQLNADLLALRQVPGVKAAAVSNVVPFGGSSWNGDLSLVPDAQQAATNASIYMGGKDSIETMGLNLVQGRVFHQDEYQVWDKEPGPLPVAIITQSLAQFLFPGESPLGKEIFVWGSEPKEVIGVVEHLVRPNNQGGPSKRYHAVLLPVASPGGVYVVRSHPHDKSKVLAASQKALKTVDPTRVITKHTTFTQIIHEYYQTDRAMQWLLVILSSLVVVVTSLGIVGLVSYQVQTRQKEVGVRRALGAARHRILGQFLAETSLVSLVGLALGWVLSLIVSQLLVTHHGFDPLPWTHLASCTLLLLLMSHSAVFWPALRASKISPAIATRTV